MARKSNDPIINIVDKTSLPIIKLLALTPITSVQTTLLGFFACVIPAAYLFSTGIYFNGIIAVLLLVLAAWFDFADGAIARMKNQCSPLGAWIDPAIDIIAQGVILLGVIIGAYQSTGDTLWLILGLFTIFGQLSSNFIGIEYVHKFGFDSYIGLPTFLEEFNKTKKKTFLDKSLKQLIMPTNFFATFIYTIRYFIIIGAILNVLWLSVLALAIMINFRWIVMFIVYAISLKPEKSKLVTVEALKKLRR